MATPAKLTKKQQKQQKQVPAKTSLCSPYGAQWRSLPQPDMLFILSALKDKLQSIGLEKKETNPFRPWRKKKKTNEKEPVTSPPPVIPPSSPKSGWTAVEARSQLAIGINEVTKGLERNQLSLVLVCKSVKPAHMTSHLIALSRSRAVPACQVPQLSPTISQPLGLKSVLALGFRNRGGPSQPHHGGIFADTVDAIVPRVPPLHVEWMPDATGTAAAVTREDDDDNTGERRGRARWTRPTGRSRGPTLNRKRKFEEQKDAAAEEPYEEDGKMEVERDDDKVDDGAGRSAVVDDATKPTSCSLQPLKVKKIIPNPLKKRKQKKNKKKSKA